MATTIRIDENIKQQLKLKSAQTGISQLDLANRYILNGLKEDSTPNKKSYDIRSNRKIFRA